MSSVGCRTNLAIVLHSFVPNPSVERPNSRAAGASLDDAHALMLPTNDYCTDRFVEHPSSVAGALVALDADFGLVDAADELAVASTFVGFVALKFQFVCLFDSSFFFH